MWLGTDLSLSRQVAVKLLKPSLASDPIVAERFRREAVAVANLNHPNIVAVYDAIEDNGRQAVVMQLVNGKSLRQLLDEQKRLSPDLTIHIGSCVASALDAAHRAGMVHRDVKPGNILITPDGRVLLTDFGIAKGLESEGDDLTNDNIMMGTAKYLSPEQVRGKRLDGRADLYSLGLVLYECLAGRVPFLGQNDADTALARLQRDPTDITRLRPTLPAGLPELIHRLLARRPDQRYPTGAAVRAALLEVTARANDRSLVDPTLSDHTGPGQTGPGQTGTGRIGPGQGRAAGGRAGVYDQAAPVGGYQPVRATGRVAGSPVRAADRTPTGQSRVQQRPNRRFDQRRSPSLIVVGGLLLAAIVVTAMLWSTLGTDEPGDGAELDTTATDAGTGAPDAAGDPVAVTGSAFASIAAYDPDGDDGTENDELATLAVDGDPTTGWSTSCYASATMGGKAGVGLAATLATPAAGRLTISVASASWQLQVFTSQNDAVPATIADWGVAAATSNGDAAEVVTVPLTSPARHVLVVFTGLGQGGGCSGDLPYRGTIAEVQFESIA